MAIGVLFEASGTWEQYETSVAKLEQAGWGSPKARRYHVAGRTEGGFRVVDVWDSAESFAEFGEVLMPILHEVGMTPPEPQIWPADNIIEP